MASGMPYTSLKRRHTMNLCTSCAFFELIFLLLCLIETESYSCGPKSRPQRAITLRLDARRENTELLKVPVRYRETLRLHATSDNDSNNDENDLLQSLEESLDYKGRLPSKLSTEEEYHCGFVSIIGAANMGKSTLLNCLLEQDLSVATRRPQTTRHAILGVVTSPTTQLLLLDTPGILQDVAYTLQEGMMQAVKGAVDSADVLLVVTDLFSTPIPNDALFEKVQQLKKPKIVVINKVDLVDKVNPAKYENDDDEREKTVTVEEAVLKWRMLLPDAMLILPVSASEGMSVSLLRDVLLAQGDIPASLRDLGRPIPGMFRNDKTTLTQEEARALLPMSPPLYSEDTLTDRSERYVQC